MYPSYGTILILINFQLSVNIHSTFVGIKKRKTAFPIEFVQFIEPLNRVIFGKKEARFILDVQHHRSFPFILYDWHKFDIRDSIVHAYSFDSRYVGQPLHLLWKFVGTIDSFHAHSDVGDTFQSPSIHIARFLVHIFESHYFQRARQLQNTNRSNQNRMKSDLGRRVHGEHILNWWIWFEFLFLRLLHESPHRLNFHLRT